jgi:3-isopropylmalate/(R)-2-methylmalate dehydratase large subunit
MTITEKILAAHAGLEEVRPGQLIQARVDRVLGNDITAPLAIREFKKLGLDRVFDPEAIVLVPDHFTPNKDIASAEQARVVREFARQFNITHYYEVGRAGIEHCLLPEEGLVLPGELIIGADSHTCTYGALGAFATGIGSTDMAAAMATGECWFRVPENLKLIYYGELQPWVGGKDLILYTIGRLGVDGARYMAMEFTGEAISRLPMSGRFTMANMAVEAGAKNGIFIPDAATINYVEKRARRPYRLFTSDEDAEYAQVIEINVREIRPQVAFPPSPGNVRPVEEAQGIEIDQVVIGSCTNGWLDDLRVAAQVMAGHKVHPNVRCVVIPGTPRILREAIKEGLIDVFLEAGAAVSTPTCGPCLGGHMGVLARGERAVATTNRNFVGRMGHPESEVYLANPAVAAASAVMGRIASPEELV